MFWFCAFSCCSWHFNMHLILTVIQVEYELSQGVMFQMLGVQLMALLQCGNLRRKDQARGSRPPGGESLRLYYPYPLPALLTAVVSPEAKSPPPVQSPTAMMISCLPTWLGPSHHEPDSWTHEPKWIFPSSVFISDVHYFRGTRSLALPRTLKTTISLLWELTLTTTLIRLLFML